MAGSKPFALTEPYRDHAAAFLRLWESIQSRLGTAKRASPLARLSQSLVWGSAATLLAALPGSPAERIVFTYGQIELYLSVESLEAYAKDGTITPDLAFYLRFLKPEDIPKLRDALNASREIDPVSVSQALYSPMGETAVQNLGELFRTTTNQNGFYAVRAAAIQAAADPGGLSILGLLQHFPTQDLRISIPVVLSLVRDVDKFANQTDAVVHNIEALSATAAEASDPLDLASLPQVLQPGPFQFKKQTWNLQDSRLGSARAVPTDIYTPIFPPGQTPDSIPVVVFSHGLWETPEFAASFMEHLASYGFVVAAPDHIGSDQGQKQRLLSGLSQTGSELNEFYDRPLDVSFVLDTLEQRNSSDFDGRLNLHQVGVFGHSYGGYTALVLGGATIDFERLHRLCQPGGVLEALDPSLVLECQALRLESSPEAVEMLTSGQLRDPRVSLVVALSPVTNAIFGPSGLNQVQVPVVIFGGGNDPAAPLVTEQVEAFSWLPSTDKYLLVANDLSHTPQITERIDQVTLPGLSAAEVGQKLDAFLTHFRGLGLALMQVYVAGRPEYQPYLQSAYTETLADPPLKFSLLRSLSPELLEQVQQNNP
jgi:predicted dienelactone hydrolase